MKFIFGRELDTDEIYDRKDEINSIIKSCNIRQPLAIIGYRRMGKSSILNAAKTILEKQDMIVIKFNVEGISSIKEYSDRLLMSMMDSLSKKYKIKYYKEEIKRRINLFLGSIEQIGLKVDNFEILFKRYSDYLDHRLKTSEIIETVLDMPEKLAEDLRLRIIVMIDEFQYIRVLKEPFPDILRVMRSKFNQHKLVNYIISGSEIGILDEMLNDKNEPFYAFFRTIEIGAFSYVQSIDFLTTGLKSEGINCDREILENVYQITSGIPAWLNLAGIDLTDKCSIDSFLKDPTYRNIINRELAGLTKNETAMMKELSQNTRLSEISISNKYRVVQSLINKGLIKKYENNYVVVDSLVKYYIENNLL
ncbi:MAG: ATP-binding protein [Ferroplasma sp.]|uniref:AAA family ATPase n=1 Tax=Ferroplasma sp. TaxID=2591003 RepID=UPI00281614D5|nr:ATP-binding protein [Ferroplasma sp.]WMT50563.1 MAG: ATP-binding protein [Ferroplasma sp.]